MSFSVLSNVWNRVRLPITAAVVALGLFGSASGLNADEEASSATAPTRAVDHSSAELRQLRRWLEEKGRSQAPSMPHEARLAYRRGLTAWKSGEEAAAVSLVRGAADLDPSFAAPHLTLMQWFVTREPSQALLSGAALVHRLKNDFALQLELAGNALFVGITALYFALLATALILIGLHQHELRHVWQERLGILLSGRSAKLWAWTFLFLPWALGLGLGIPALVMLGMLWPVLKARERFVFVALVAMVAAAPIAPTLMGRLALPLRDQGAPFHNALALENAADPAEVQESLTGVALSEPDNGFAQFTLAWNARRAGDLSAAEAAYRHALEAWPNNDRALNNLGNLLAMQGQFTEALEYYERAASQAPRNAAPHFNASQVHTRLFNYGEASDEVARASALDFELVRSYQARTGDDLPLVDQWIAPATFWSALARVPADAVPAALPPGWGAMVETSGWPYAGLALGLALLGLALGLWWQRRMPLRTCSNCARPVCRRCAHRQREQALCSGCAAIAARAESPEFGRVLLGQQRRRVERIRGAVRAAFVALIPGVGLAAARRVFTAVTVMVGIACLVMPWLEARAPFALGTGLEVAFDTPGWLIAASWLLAYGLSILGFLTRPADAEPEASRASGRASLPFAEPPARAA